MGEESLIGTLGPQQERQPRGELERIEGLGGIGAVVPLDPEQEVRRHEDREQGAAQAQAAGERARRVHEREASLQLVGGRRPTEGAQQQRLEDGARLPLEAGPRTAIRRDSFEHLLRDVEVLLDHHVGQEHHVPDRVEAVRSGVRGEGGARVDAQAEQVLDAALELEAGQAPQRGCPRRLCRSRELVQGRDERRARVLGEAGRGLPAGGRHLAQLDPVDELQPQLRLRPGDLQRIPGQLESGLGVLPGVALHARGREGGADLLEGVLAGRERPEGDRRDGEEAHSSPSSARSSSFRRRASSRCRRSASPLATMASTASGSRVNTCRAPPSPTVICVG